MAFPLWYFVTSSERMVSIGYWGATLLSPYLLGVCSFCYAIMYFEHRAARGERSLWLFVS